MIIVSKKFDEDRRSSKRIFEKMQNIPLTHLVGIKYSASKEYSSPDYTIETNTVKNILINFDKEITRYWLVDVLPFFYIWYEEDKNKKQLDIENNNEHQIIIVDYLKKIFSTGLYKTENKTWQIIEKQKTIENSLILKFINKIGESCKNIVKQILSNNEENYLNYYSRKIMDTDEGLLSLFNLDTLHDISRVSFLEDTYNKLFKRNFMTDYKTWLFNNRYLTQEIFTVKQQSNFEKKLLAYLIKNNDTLKKQKDMNREEIVNFIKNHNKGSIDVWTDRKTLETDYNLKINNLYTSYFDSNPTNSNYENNKTDIENCNLLSFNLGSIEVKYIYDNTASLLEIELSFSTNHFQNPSSMIINKKEDNCIIYPDIIEKYKSYPEFNDYIEKILYKCYYDNENNKFIFRGKKTGPSISMLCAIALLIIDRDKNISSGLKKGEKFSINLAMLIFEQAFMLKRIGDLGQILLANRLGYIFATNDHLQAIISILAGNMTLTTCGNIKLFYLESMNRLTNLLSLSCKKRDRIDKKIGQKRKIIK